MNLHSLPVIGRFLQQLDTDVNKFGLQAAMANIVTRSNTKLVIKGKTPSLTSVLRKKPVIIVANHPYDSEEVALIASLPSRKDMYLIVSSHFMGVSRSLDTYLIPVYIWHHVTSGKPKKFFGKLLHKLHTTPIYSPDEEHKRNIESLSVATKIINEGGLVIIFPGRRNKDGHWFSGVGHLMRGLNKNTRAYVVKAYVEGTSDRDYLRMLPGLGRFLPTIRVTFADPIEASNLIMNDGKKIATLLEEDYNGWVGTLKLR